MRLKLTETDGGQEEVRALGRHVQTVVCLLICSFPHNNNFVDAGSLPTMRETMSEMLECVYSNVKRLTKPWIASLQV